VGGNEEIKFFQSLLSGDLLGPTTATAYSISDQIDLNQTASDFEGLVVSLTVSFQDLVFW
jgi:hypothetical protein